MHYIPVAPLPPPPKTAAIFRDFKKSTAMCKVHNVGLRYIKLWELKPSIPAVGRGGRLVKNYLSTSYVIFIRATCNFTSSPTPPPPPRSHMTMMNVAADVKGS